jgi:hypothetical protein
MHAPEREGLDSSDVTLVQAVFTYTEVGTRVYLEIQILDSETGVDDIGDISFIDVPFIAYHYIADGVPE